MKCTHCGGEIPEGTRFCKYCGSAVMNVNGEPVEQTSTEQTPVEQTAQVAEPVKGTPEKKRRLRPNGGQVAGSVILAILMCTVLFAFVNMTIFRSAISASSIDNIFKGVDFSKFSIGELLKSMGLATTDNEDEDETPQETEVSTSEEDGELMSKARPMDHKVFANRAQAVDTASSMSSGMIIHEDDTLADIIYNNNKDFFDEQNVSKQMIEKCFEDDEVLAAISNQLGDVTEAFFSEEGIEISEDTIVALVEDNRELLKEKLGLEITDQDISDIRTGLEDAGFEPIKISADDISEGLSEMMEEQSTEIKEVVEIVGGMMEFLRFFIVNYETIRYILLGIAVFLALMILLINIKVIYAGLRTLGISATVVGAISTIGALIGIGILRGVSANITETWGQELMNSALDSLNQNALIVTLPILGGGIVFIIVSAIIQRKYFQPER